MKINNLFFILILFIFSGCYMGSPSYKVFERNMNSSVGNSFIPYMNKRKREIYSEDKYIYVGKIGQCKYGYLTNRDDKKEVVQEWFIISGKEYCKEQQKWIFSF